MSTELWKQGEAMKLAMDRTSSALGKLYMELEGLDKTREQLKTMINAEKAKYQVLAQQLDQTNRAILIAEGHESSDGDYSLDFDNQRVVKHGPLPDLGNS